jgi:NDP-sugar pyrophosphorylase family protein
VLPIAILAGGMATRLRPITDTIPKALVEIAGEPFLAHQLRLLRANGYEHVVLLVGYRGEMVREFAGDGRAFGLNIEYAFDGPKLLGTAGAIARALPLLGESFSVIYGDSYLPCDYAAAEATFLQSGKTGLMSIHRNEGQWDASNVEFDGVHIVRYDKANRTPQMHHIDYGLGVFRREAFSGFAPDEVYDLAALYQDLLARGELAAWEVSQRFYEIGSVEGIRELTEYLSR